MAKRTYILEYKDFARRERVKELPTKDIITAMNEAKKFCLANGITLGWVVSPNGRRYIV